MKNFLKTTGLLLLVANTTVYAEEIYDPLEDIKVVVSLRGGVANAAVGESKTINPYYNVSAPERFVVENDRQTKAVWGGLLGLEMPIDDSERFFWQSGAAYYVTNEFHVDGTVHNLSTPDQLRDFEYKVLNQRVMWENKLIAKLNERFSFYLLGGLGMAINKAYDYEETPRSGVGVSPEIEDKTKDSFSYTAGLGVEVALIEDLRLGVGYQFSNLGEIKLGEANVPTPSQDTLSQNTTFTNEFIATLTYAFNI
jgi:opacity protein-like surface antigen